MRSIALVALALTALGFAVAANGWLDFRPVRRILWLGDSYTYSNNLPAMVAEMADSAGSEVRYDITMKAFANASLEDHWRSAKTQALLAASDWDRVLVQPESTFRALEAGSPFFAYGARLLGGGRPRPAIVVSWTASEALYEDDPISRPEHFQNIERNHKGLAMKTGAELIDAAQV
ncbi:hypothetical protein E2493_14880 [Sphingomonas parva]|uniref:SGNH/GDSL hydrolase family protein n=1 Tax=Sphingomonas parva TaxID=2555898 RepID=A0A4Y8ZRS2_9SPHN|nr:hypothetical protein [Sphingomonas parva]TFI57489.1 hypothetical protein E2493_14880 [Sphingomonas parva]